MTTQEILLEYKKKVQNKLESSDYIGNAVFGGMLSFTNLPSTNEMFIAGGCIRSILENETPKDIDIFLKPSVDLEKFRTSMKSTFPEATFTDNAVTLHIDGMKYQFITTCTGTPMDVVNEFDFTMNMNYFDFEDDTLYIHDKLAIFDKQLKVNLNCRNKLGTLARIAKFVERGYKVPKKANLLELGVQLTREEPVETFEKMQKESRMFVTRDEYEGLSVVSNSADYDSVVSNYRGSSV